MRFVVAGAANTLFGLGVYTVAIVSGLPVWGALLVGNVVGIAFNFFTTSGFVFRSLLLRRLPRFAGIYLFLFGLNFAAIGWLDDAGIGPISAQIVLTPLMALLSYFLLTSFVFATKPEAARETTL